MCLFNTIIQSISNTVISNKSVIYINSSKTLRSVQKKIICLKSYFWNILRLFIITGWLVFFWHNKNHFMDFREPFHGLVIIFFEICFNHIWDSFSKNALSCFQWNFDPKTPKYTDTVKIHRHRKTQTFFRSAFFQSTLWRFSARIFLSRTHSIGIKH